MKISLPANTGATRNFLVFFLMALVFVFAYPVSAPALAEANNDKSAVPSTQAAPRVVAIDPTLKIIDNLTDYSRSIQPDRHVLNRYLPEWSRATVFLYPTWKWLALLAAVFITWLFRRIFRLALAIAEKVAARSPARWDDRILHAIVNPSALAGSALVWFACIQFIGFSGNSLAVFTIITKMLLGYGFVWAAYNFTDFFIEYSDFLLTRAGKPVQQNLMHLFHRFLKLTVVVLGFLFFFQNLGINVMSVLAGLGLGGLAFALAAKDTCANFFGSVMILLDQPFQVGDWIKVGSEEGTVEEIGFRSTRIRTFYNSVVSLPNSKVANENIDNLGRREFRRVRAFFGVTYDTPPEKMERFVDGIKEIVLQNEFTRKDYFHVCFNAYKDSCLEVMLYCFLRVPDWGEELKQREQIFLQVYRLADSLGISFAFPTQTLHIDSIPERSMLGTSGAEPRQ